MSHLIEKMLSGISFATIWRISELRNRLSFTFIMLCIYRLGSRFPIPGVDVFLAMQDGMSVGVGYFFKTVNSFGGGALSRVSIMSLGIMPYLTANLFMDLLSKTSDDWIAIRKDGEAGRAVINQWTRYLAAVVAVVQASMAAYVIHSRGLVICDPYLFYISAVCSMTSGTMFLIWVGEQITKMGIGDGNSVLLCAGILSSLPQSIGIIVDMFKLGAVSKVSIAMFALFFVVCMLIVVFLESSQRRIPLVSPRHSTPGAQSMNYIPIKVNVANIAPAIFANMFLSVLSVGYMTLSSIVNYFEFSTGIWILYRTTEILASFQEVILGCLIFIASIVYATFALPPEDIAERLNKEGSFIPGCRPGQRTVEFLEELLLYISIIGGVYLSCVCVLPDYICRAAFDPMMFSGTTIVIVTNIIIEIINQISTHVVSAQYRKITDVSKRGLHSLRRVSSKLIKR